MLRYWRGQRRHDQPHRLRHDDQPHRLRPRCRPSAAAASVWPCAHRHDAGAHDLGDEAGGVGDEAEHQRGEFRDRSAARPQVEAREFGELEADRPAGGEIGDRRQARTISASARPRRRAPARPSVACRRRAQTRRAERRDDGRAPARRRPARRRPQNIGARQVEAAIVEEDDAAERSATAAAPAASSAPRCTRTAIAAAAACCASTRHRRSAMRDSIQFGDSRATPTAKPSGVASAMQIAPTSSVLSEADPERAAVGRQRGIGDQRQVDVEAGGLVPEAEAHRNAARAAC